MNSDTMTFVSVRGPSRATVTGSLVHLMTQSGRLKLADVLTDVNQTPEGRLEYAVGPGGDWVTLITPEPFETLSADLSHLLGAPTFLFHLHEGDTWLYWFYLNGRQLDHFDSLPEYWDSDLPAQAEQSEGKPRLIGETLGIDPQTIAPYLHRELGDAPEVSDEYDEVNLALEMLDTDARVSPDDRYDLWDARVMFDFMRRLGITPPVDASGQPTAPLTILRFESAS